MLVKGATRQLIIAEKIQCQRVSIGVKQLILAQNDQNFADILMKLYSLLVKMIEFQFQLHCIFFKRLKLPILANIGSRNHMALN